ncbi:MAG: biotin synthase BioB [Candidatus Omnitrophota bacterium]
MSIRTLFEKVSKSSLSELLSEAEAVRKSYAMKKIELCCIFNAKSGLCKQDCKFCAQSSPSNSKIDTYELKSQKEIVVAAQKAKAMGAERFSIVTSGNRLNWIEINRIGEAICQIREEVGIKVCASLGALKREELYVLQECGLTRYHHNIETSEEFYTNVVSTHKFEDRIRTIQTAKSLGLEVCSGGILGLGEGWDDRIGMANTLKELKVDSVPLNFLIPIKGTPFGKREKLSINEALRSIALFRIVLQDKPIKIAGGREEILGDSQVEGFSAGATGMITGDYLTVKGQGLQNDQELISRVYELWNE